MDTTDMNGTDLLCRIFEILGTVLIVGVIALFAASIIYDFRQHYEAAKAVNFDPCKRPAPHTRPSTCPTK